MYLAVLPLISELLFLFKPDTGCFLQSFAVLEVKFNTRRQSEFQLSPSLRLTGASAAEAEKGAVCPADPPCK